MFATSTHENAAAARLLIRADASFSAPQGVASAFSALRARAPQPSRDAFAARKAAFSALRPRGAFGLREARPL